MTSAYDPEIEIVNSQYYVILILFVFALSYGYACISYIQLCTQINAVQVLVNLTFFFFQLNAYEVACNVRFY